MVFKLGESGTPNEILRINYDGNLDIKGAAIPKLKIMSGRTDVQDGQQIGGIEFSVPSEASGVVSTFPAVQIEAEADDTFDTNNNATDFVLKLGRANTSSFPREVLRVEHEGNMNLIGTVTATAFEGDGSALTDIDAAKGGGTDHTFIETDNSVNTSYTLSTNRNAMTVGPVTINSGATVTVPSGQRWIIL